MEKVKVIVVNGLSRSGKDSFIDAIRKKVPALIEHSTIYTVWDSLLYLDMINPIKKGPEEREFLAAVKQAWINYNEGPFKEVVHMADELEKEYAFTSNIDRVLLAVHVREPEEMKKLKRHFEDRMFTVKVTRPEITAQPGDENVNNWNYDFEVYNEGDLEYLDTLVDAFINFLNERK
jgi:hypothetical protein